MKIQTTPNRWSCLPTAFAMVMNIRVAFVIKGIGHDGGEILRPELAEPEKRRGFHPQEILSYAWLREIAFTPFEANPQSFVAESDPYKIDFPEGNQERLLTLLAKNIGVLTGQSLPGGQSHAVAWSGPAGKIYNPNGKIQGLEEFAINTFWCLSHRAD